MAPVGFAFVAAPFLYLILASVGQPSLGSEVPWRDGLWLPWMAGSLLLMLAATGVLVPTQRVRGAEGRNHVAALLPVSFWRQERYAALGRLAALAFWQAAGVTLAVMAWALAGVTGSRVPSLSPIGLWVAIGVLALALDRSQRWVREAQALGTPRTGRPVVEMFWIWLLLRLVASWTRDRPLPNSALFAIVAAFSAVVWVLIPAAVLRLVGRRQAPVEGISFPLPFDDCASPDVLLGHGRGARWRDYAATALPTVARLAALGGLLALGWPFLARAFPASQGASRFLWLAWLCPLLVSLAAAPATLLMWGEDLATTGPARPASRLLPVTMRDRWRVRLLAALLLSLLCAAAAALVSVLGLVAGRWVGVTLPTALQPFLLLPALAPAATLIIWAQGSLLSMPFRARPDSEWGWGIILVSTVIVVLGVALPLAYGASDWVRPYAIAVHVCAIVLVAFSYLTVRPEGWALSRSGELTTGANCLMLAAFGLSSLGIGLLVACLVLLIVGP